MVAGEYTLVWRVNEFDKSLPGPDLTMVIAMPVSCEHSVLGADEKVCGGRGAGSRTHRDSWASSVQHQRFRMLNTQTGRR